MVALTMLVAACGSDVTPPPVADAGDVGVDAGAPIDGGDVGADGPALTDGGGDAHFIDLGDGTVRDRASGLVWEQVSDGFTLRSQADSATYCMYLTVGGSGWRLPTLDELLSLVDTRFTPTIDPSFFPETPNDSFWSSSSLAGDPVFGWVVDFGGDGMAHQNLAGSVNRARCVR
jgi:hypothetical protein